MDEWVGGWTDGRTDGRIGGWIDRWMDLEILCQKGELSEIISHKNLEILTTYINIIGKVNQAKSSLTTRTKGEKLNINI